MFQNDGFGVVDVITPFANHEDGAVLSNEDVRLFRENTSSVRKDFGKLLNSLYAKKDELEKTHFGTEEYWDVINAIHSAEFDLESFEELISCPVFDEHGNIVDEIPYGDVSNNLDVLLEEASSDTKGSTKRTLKNGYVYVFVSDSHPGLCKIGKTNRDVEKRRRELNRQHLEGDWQIHAMWLVSDPKIIEMKAHGHFAEKVKFKNEYFDVDADDAKAYIDSLVLRFGC